MSTCKSCSHWKKTEREGYTHISGAVIPAQSWPVQESGNDFEVRFCKHPKMDYYAFQQRDGARPTYDDSAIETGEDFGCVLWESL